METAGENATETIARRDQYVTLEYDFLKHITSLSLVAIGGALTFAGSLFAAAPNQSRLWLSVAILIVAGVLAFSGQQRLLKLLRTDRPVGRSVSLYREAAVLAFGFGTGILVSFAYAAVTATRPAAVPVPPIVAPAAATVGSDAAAGETPGQTAKR